MKHVSELHHCARYEKMSVNCIILIIIHLVSSLAPNQMRGKEGGPGGGRGYGGRDRGG